MATATEIKQLEAKIKDDVKQINGRIAYIDLHVYACDLFIKFTKTMTHRASENRQGRAQ